MADENPGRIEVELSFLSGQDSTAFQQMKEAIVTAAEFMKAFKALDVADATQKLVNAQKTMMQESQRLADDLKNMEDQRQRVTRLYGPGGEPLVSNVDAMRDPRQEAQRRADEARENLAEHQKSERERLTEDQREQRARREEMTDAERAADQARQRMGLPPLDPNRPQPPGGGPWYEQIESLNPAAGGLRIPQFGELTPQDVLGWLRQRQLQRAEQAPTEEERDRYGERAAMFERLSRGMGNIAGVQALFRQTQRHITQPIQGFTAALETPGTQLGYDRNIIDLPIIPGMAIPWSPAGQEGLRQISDQFQMRWMGGINQEQAAQINQTVAGMGYSGGLGSDLRRQFLAPLVQQTGVNAEAVAPIMDAVRYGQTNIQDLTEALSGLGEGARASRMNIDEYTQSLAQLGEQARQQGGTMAGGVTLGQQMSRAYGVQPGVTATLLQSPIAQAYIGAASGLPADMAGAASPLTQQRAITRALRDRVAAYNNRLPSHREPIYGPDGRTVVGYETTSGDDAAIARAGMDFGLSQEQARQMLSAQGPEAISNFEAGTRAWGAGVMPEGRNAGARGREFMLNLRRREHDKTLRFDAQYRFNRQTGNIESKNRFLDPQWHVAKGETEEMRQFVYGDNLRTGDPGGNAPSFKELQDIAMSAGVSKEKWKEKVEHLRTTDPMLAMRHARDLMAERGIDVNQDPNAIKFTGPAAKFFTALIDKFGDLAGASDLSRAAVATSNRGSRPTSSATAAAGALGAPVVPSNTGP